MPSSIVHIENAQQSPLECVLVTVCICDRRKQHCTHITNIPRSLLKRCAPDVIHLIEAYPQSDELLLPLRLRSLEHAHNIQIPALTRVFTHWSSNTSRKHSSISEAVLDFCALQLLLNPEAEDVRTAILQRLRTEPVDEIDFQTIWWTLHGTPDFNDWLDALLYNLARFSVLQKQPAGGYISLFMENELLQLSEKARELVFSLYYKHRSACEPSVLRRAFRRISCAGR